MADKLIMFGNSDFAKLITKYISLYSAYTCVAYTVDESYITSETLLGKPILPFDKIEHLFPPEEYLALVAVGYRKMSENRRDAFLRIKEKGYKVANFVHPSVDVRTTEMGEGNIILEGTIVAMDVEIGNANVIWNGCNISHECRIGDFNYLAPSVTLGGKTTVANNCFFGVGSTVRSGRSVSPYSLVGAGAYVNASTEPYGVYVPSRTVYLEGRSSYEIGERI